MHKKYAKKEQENFKQYHSKLQHIFEEPHPKPVNTPKRRVQVPVFLITRSKSILLLIQINDVVNVYKNTSRLCPCDQVSCGRGLRDPMLSHSTKRQCKQLVVSFLLGTYIWCCKHQSYTFPFPWI